MPYQADNPAVGRAQDRDVFWERVLPFVHRSWPAPLSRPLRTALRQPDLASVCRVSKTLQRIATPLLYRTLVTDDFPSLIANIDLSLRTSPLRQTRHLFIEYSNKKTAPSYVELCRDGPILWLGCGMLTQELSKLQVVDCRVELERMLECVLHLREVGIARVFPRLKTLAISSIYGKADDSYARYRPMAHATQTAGAEGCAFLFQMVMDTSPTLSHICTRQVLSPLSPPTGVFPDVPPGRFARTIHFGGLYDGQLKVRDVINLHGPDMVLTPYQLNIPLNDTIVVPLGLPVRLYSDFESSNNFQELEYYVKQTILGSVVPEAPNPIWHATQPQQDLSTTVLHTLGLPSTEGGCDQQYVLSAEQQRLLADIKGKALQKMERDKGGEHHSVRWYTSGDAPPCMACGSVPPV
ncbi:uncharacterized protein MKK02DRAFT_38064 [Dioszegia hungarica]|uniref:F-box domain-containing protein n=1 Tax=Dioszegia hungarica TaxID=4972 RepID=A0AA38H5M2_9TREE|nr:uncharacterized protein MKK02DRAFT_38064 [Dioszegia hungarica]KAI9634535.1 hypothetical protein MKK02DRAFT_38064 [Dioszegia hungarica]